PSASADASTNSSPEVQNLSRTELMRRERVREEVKNEDILQERLEELRLRDEKRRTEAVMGSQSQSQSQSQASGIAASEVVVTPPATERPGQGSAQIQQPLVVAQNGPTSDATFSSSASSDEGTKVWIQPRGG